MEVTQLDLPIQDVERLRKVLNKHMPFKNVWAYGSRVKGTASKHSDLDMVVFGVSEAQLYETREALEESNVPVEVQLFRWEDLPTNFHENIQQAYYVVQRETDWQETTLEAILEIIGGGTPKTTEPLYWDGNTPWLSVVDFNTGRKYVSNTEKTITELGLKNSSTRLLNKGDIIISARGTVGALAVLNKDMTFNQSCYGIRAKTNHSTNEFAYYLLKQAIGELQQVSHGGVFDTITRDTFKEVSVLLPPLPEQRAIADVLSSLDDKIDLLHRQNQTLEALAETLFRQWFIEEADPDWEYSTIKQYVSTIDNRGKTPPNISEQTKYPIIEVNALGKNSRLIDYSLIRKYVTEDTFNTWFRGKPKKFSTLISTVGSIGFLSMYLLEVGNIAQNIICLEPKKISPFYLYQYLKFKTEDILNLDIGGVQPSIKVPHLLDLELLIPSREKLDAFDVHALAMVKKMETNYIQIQTLERLRDALLPKLMSGEVRINQINLEGETQ